MYTHTYRHTYIHTYTQTDIHTYVQTYIHTYTHTYMFISKYLYSRPTYLYTNIQTFDNVWLKTTVPRDNSERNKHSCACSTLHSTGESCCEFFMVAELCLTRGISKQQQ